MKQHPSVNIVFPRPVKILQVYRMVNRYGKEEKAFPQRQDKLRWRSVSSVSGFVQQGVLYLPAAIAEDPRFGNCGLITLEDNQVQAPGDAWTLIGERFDRGPNHCFNLHHPNIYELFSLEKDPLELWLRYNHSLIGEPSRDNFKLANLETTPVVEVKINGKTDNYSGRHFTEKHYIFEYLGEFRQCVLKDEPMVRTLKTPPAETRLVDLLKTLW